MMFHLGHLRRVVDPDWRAKEREDLERDLERQRREQARVDAKTWGMGCNE